MGAMLDVIPTSRPCADTGAKSHVSLLVASLAIRREHCSRVESIELPKRWFSDVSTNSSRLEVLYSRSSFVKEVMTLGFPNFG